jgi:hypothetical protein
VFIDTLAKMCHHQWSRSTIFALIPTHSILQSAVYAWLGAYFGEYLVSREATIFNIGSNGIDRGWRVA